MADEIHNPQHYDGATVDAMTAMSSMMHAMPEHTKDGRAITSTAFYWLGCTFKYVWRWSRKDGIKDLRKAKQCIDYLIREVYGPHASTD